MAHGDHSSGQHCRETPMCTHTYTPWKSSRVISTVDKPLSSFCRAASCMACTEATLDTWSLWRTGCIPHISLYKALGKNKVFFGLSKLWATWKTQRKKRREHTPSPPQKDSGYLDRVDASAGSNLTHKQDKTTFVHKLVKQLATASCSNLH